MNPLQILGMMKNGGNPQAMVMQMLEGSVQGNPALANLLSLAKQGNTAEIEKFARNYFASMGKDFDKEFNDFRRMSGL